MVRKGGHDKTSAYFDSPRRSTGVCFYSYHLSVFVAVLLTLFTAQIDSQMKPIMVLTNEAIKRIRDMLAKVFGSSHKIVIAPCMAEVYVNKNRDSFRKPAKVKWNSVDRGVIALVFDTDSCSKRLLICLTSPKSGDVLWKETVVPYSTVASPHPTFQTINSTRNFCEQAGILYENKTVARLVFQALELFTSHDKDPSKVKGTNVMRSHSFNVAPRPKHPVASVGELLGEPLLGRVCSTVSESRGNRVGIEEEHRASRRVVRRKTEPLKPRLSRVIETDLCTTEL